MKKYFIFTMLFVFSLSLSADYKTGEKIFKSKCSSCHTGYVSGKIIEENFYKKNNTLLNLAAPTVNMLAYFLKDAPTHIGDKKDPDMQKLEIDSFLQDYLYHPNRANSIISHNFLKYFDKKKSLKGIVSQEEISNITDYLFGYKKRNTKDIKKVELSSMNSIDLIKKAKKEHKLILVEAMSKTCYYCEKMKKDVISLPDVQNAINKNFIYIIIDVDKTELPLNLGKKYRKMTPTFFTLTSDGKFLHDYPGAWNKSDFMKILRENLHKK